MKRITLALALALAVALGSLTGCPEPAEVGAIPHQQVDDARNRVHAAEKKIEKQTNAAAAVTE